MSHDIFLSYSRKDLDLMHKVCADLQKAGFRVWTDEGIEPGTPLWKDAIETAIENAGFLVALLSPDSKKSIWVKRELDYAAVQKVQILSLLCGGDESNAIPFALIGSQYIDIRTDYKQIQLLIASLSKQIGGVQPLNSVKLEGSLAISVIPSNVLKVIPPPFQWCVVEAGIVNIEGAGDRRGTNGGMYRVERFYIAKYPVTNAQYQVFVDASDGYRDPEWWDYSVDAKNFRKIHVNPKNTMYPGNDLPRTNVSWYDAVAFCRWLSHRTLESISLPTEQQWQRAAIGDKNWVYPWGDDIDIARCNYGGNIDNPTSVMNYPGGASPYGVMDMSGNVWEWCLTKWVSDNSDVSGDYARVIRGGSFDVSSDAARAAFRHFYFPHSRIGDFGFRCVLTPNS